MEEEEGKVWSLMDEDGDGRYPANRLVSNEKERERERFLSRAFIGTGALVKPKNGTTAIEMLRKLHGS